MLAPRPQRDILSWRRKLDDYKSLPSAGIEISNDGTPRFPDAFVPSEELDLFLARKTASSAMVEDLSMLPIPFAAPATNLVTGKRVVMQGLHTESSYACVNVGAGSLFTSQTGR